jgi:hypothetical protein
MRHLAYSCASYYVIVTRQPLSTLAIVNGLLLLSDITCVRAVSHYVIRYHVFATQLRNTLPRYNCARQALQCAQRHIVGRGLRKSVTLLLSHRFTSVSKPTTQKSFECCLSHFCIWSGINCCFRMSLRISQPSSETPYMTNTSHCKQDTFFFIKILCIESFCPQKNAQQNTAFW